MKKALLAILWRFPYRAHTLIFDATGYRLVKQHYDCTGQPPEYYWTKEYPSNTPRREIKV